MTDIEYLVEEQESGGRIDVFLSGKLEDLSRSHIQKLLKDMNLRIL